ncbi:unnamed protein product, partial [Hymenolepis diminuta]
TKHYLTYQASKVHKHTRSSLSAFRLPDNRFQHIHLCVLDLLPPTNSFTHISTCLNRFTHWPIAVPLRDTSSESMVKALEDLGCIPEELVFCTTLFLPGEMVLDSKEKDKTDSLFYATHLKDHFRSIHPVPTRENGRAAQIHNDLLTCPFVFVRVDVDLVSNDKLKPAYLEPPDVNPPDYPPYLYSNLLPVVSPDNVHPI